MLKPFPIHSLSSPLTAKASAQANVKPGEKSEKGGVEKQDTIMRLGPEYRCLMHVISITTWCLRFVDTLIRVIASEVRTLSSFLIG